MIKKCVEFKNFSETFRNCTIGLRDMKQLEEEVLITEIFNPYKLKLIKKNLPVFKIRIQIQKGLNTDLYFVKIEIQEKDRIRFDKWIYAFRDSWKYKVQLTKSERSLLWNINTQKEDIHKNIFEEDSEPGYQNEPQKFMSEKEFQWQKTLERRRFRQIEISYRKTLREVGDKDFYNKWKRVIKLFS